MLHSLPAPSQCTLGWASKLQVAGGGPLRGLCRPPRASRDHRVPQGPQDGIAAAGNLVHAVAASLIACSFVLHVNAARAEASWKPRRHHRHIGERFTDTWADAIVEREEATVEQIRDLQKQLRQEKIRADDEAKKRKEAEARLRSYVIEQKNAKASYEDDGFVSIRLAGADITGPLFFFAVMGGSYYAYTTDLLGRLTGKPRKGVKGKWVYDRALGGRKVWVEDAEASSQLAPHMSDADFSTLTSIAAKKAPSQAAAGPYQPPDWWRPAANFPATGLVKADKQLEASRLMTRLERAKNRGEDYPLDDVLLLRKVCQTGGGVTVDARTVGGRDAIFRTAVEAGIQSCQDPGTVDLGGEEPLQLVAGLAGDLQIPDERAVAMASGWVAAASRSRLVDAIAALKEGNEAGALLALARLASLLERMPVMEPSSTNVELIASELDTWADEEVRAKVLQLARQENPAILPVVAAMLGLDLARVEQQQPQQQSGQGS